MRRYELMLLLRPDMEDDKLQAAVERVTRAIVNGGGSLSKVSPWGKRRLAYDIGRHREASYFLIHFDIEPAQVREIERGLLISEEILRHLVTVLEDRGPAEELAPAVAPRRTDADAEADADGGADVDDGREGSPAIAAIPAAGDAYDDMPSVDAADDEDDDTSEDTSEGTSEDTSEGTSEEGPADEASEPDPADAERAGA